MTNNAHQTQSNTTAANGSYHPTLIQELVRYAYSTVWLVLLPLTLVGSIYKGLTRSREYWQRLPERYGFIPSAVESGGILIHCVSVGEVVSVTPLIKHLQAQNPHSNITVTTTTPTGSQRVRATFGESVHNLYLPYDVPYAVKRLLKKLAPSSLLIVEVELWPNLIHYAWLQQIPITIVNARLTNSSYRNYAKLAALFAPVLKKVTTLCAQGKRDHDNYLKFGVNPKRVKLTNNIKFDQALAPEEIAQAERYTHELQLQSRQVLIGGSTHEPEEQLLIEAYTQLKSDHPNLLLLLVPRHPQRFGKVAKLVLNNNLTLQKISDTASINNTTDVLLADKMGILKPLYGTANFAFVGGSIRDRGGHNALEAAMFGIPITMGPHTYNNPEIRQVLLAAGALHQVQNSIEIAAAIRRWLEDESLRKRAGDAAQQIIANNSGALAETLAIIHANKR